MISAGSVLLPSCLPEKKKSSLALKNIKIDGDQEDLLSELSETIIPKTDTPGAKDVSAHLFALTMIDDCFTPENRNKFKKGLTGFEALVTKRFDKSFAACSLSERGEIVKSVENKSGIAEDVDFFYNSIKRLTIQAFTTSEYYLTKVQVYKLVPGRFYGCVPVKKAS